ncbi:MAG: glycoside hydrolase family 5 protein [Treponema sp.]|nr:glycoside hydrolase family 5 protein [Treponema sp.]
MKKILFIFLTLTVLFISCKQEIQTVELTLVDKSDFENMDARQFVNQMGNGINLGNTFEAVNTKLGYDALPSEYETAWGQPETTNEIIAAYKAAGFDSLRIPVAWTNTMDWKNGDFEISEDYLARVAEVVQMALDNNLYVVINDHWDNGWWGLFGSDQKLAYKVFDAIWDQVGTYFKDFDYRLVFEAGNEEWGSRFNDEINGVKGKLDTTEQYSTLNKLSQYFVDKIRAQAGNNSKRFLLIPGFDTDITNTCKSTYQMPDDNSNSVSKLIISVHYYEPSTYTILSADASWGKCQNSWGTQSEINELKKKIAKMNSFYKTGYGVIIGEYGVATKSDGSKKDGMETWMTSILDVCDQENFCPMLWDCNTFFKKKGDTLGFTDSEIAAVYLNR